MRVKQTGAYTVAAVEEATPEEVVAIVAEGARAFRLLNHLAIGKGALAPDLLFAATRSGGQIRDGFFVMNPGQPTSTQLDAASRLQIPA